MELELASDIKVNSISVFLFYPINCPELESSSIPCGVCARAKPFTNR